MNHIRERLPDMKTRINSLITQTSQELLSYGDPKLEGKSNRVRNFFNGILCISFFKKTKFSIQFNTKKKIL